MAVQYVGGGGGLFGSLGRALSLGSMFIPGLQPFSAGMNVIGGLAKGDPVGALIGGLGMMKGADGKPLLGSLFGGGYKQPMANDSFYDAMSAAHNQDSVLPAPSWGEGFGAWNKVAPPQYANYGNFDDMYTNQWAWRYRR